MQQVKVDPVSGEPLEAALASGDNAGARAVVWIDLADDEELVSKAMGGSGDDLFGASAAIHLGCVDQGHAEIDAEPQRHSLFGGMAPVLSHVPGSLPQRRHPLATAQGHKLQTFGHALLPPRTNSAT
jgi:hypothetical protein